MRHEITSLEEFQQLPSEHQALWKRIVLTASVITGSSEIIDDRHSSLLDPTLEVMNVKLDEVVLFDDDFLKNYLSPELEAMIMVNGTRELLTHLGWSL
jgi:hypothetical protein